MSVDSKEIEVWIPHRISGYFQMINPKKSNKIDNLLEIGSRGGGPALDAYGKTKITINFKETQHPQNTFNYQIYINNEEKTLDAHTSITVLEYMKPLIEKAIKKECQIFIHHTFDLPIGAGYGSSGAGALGIALGLNRIFKLGLTDLEAAKYAHIAEVKNHTGLGTVGGQFLGGFTISMEPGYPFQMKQIPINPDLRIIIASFGPISTKSILTDPIYKQLIYTVGKKSMNKIKKEYSIRNFMKTCKFFIKSTQLLEKLNLLEIKNIIGKIHEINSDDILGASLNQLGKSIFCICKKSEVNKIKNLINSFKPTFSAISLNLNINGPKFIEG